MSWWTGLVWLKILGSCEHCDEIPVSTKGGEFLDQQRLPAVSSEHGLALAVINGSQW